MQEQFFGHTNNSNPPPTLLPILRKTKDAYLIWFEHYKSIPRLHRHTLGQRVDLLLIELIEAMFAAIFTPRNERLLIVRFAIRKLDTIKLLLLMLWENKSLDNKKYIAISQRVEEIGRILGGWHGQLAKQNSPGKPGEK